MGYTYLTIIYNSLDVIVLCSLLRKINGINGFILHDFFVKLCFHTGYSAPKCSYLLEGCSVKVKRNQILNLMLFIYMLISIIILYFDLGKTNFGINFSSKINYFVPSILPTASITEAPESSALILSFSWILVILGVITMILITSWKEIDFGKTYKKTSGWVVLGVFILLPILIAFMMFSTPHDSGRFGRFIYFNLKEFKLFVILYGAGIWLSFAAGIFAASLISVSFYHNFLRS